MSFGDHQDLRAMVREVLAEEVQRLKGDSGAFAPTSPTAQVREESVSIRSSSELMAFAHRLLELSKDGRARAEIEAGRWVFRLADRGTGAGATAPTSVAGSASAAASVHFDRGLVSERQIQAIPQGSDRLVLGKRARLTPLAQDRLRQRGIRVERVK